MCICTLEKWNLSENDFYVEKKGGRGIDSFGTEQI